MKIEIDTKFLTAEQQKIVFDIAVDAKVRERMSEKAVLAGKTRRRNKRRSTKRYTATEIETIWKEYRNGNTPQRIATLIGRPVKSIRGVIYRMSNKDSKKSKTMKRILQS
jgi:hypothetical protein